MGWVSPAAAIWSAGSVDRPTIHRGSVRIYRHFRLSFRSGIERHRSRAGKHHAAAEFGFQGRPAAARRDADLND
jgi:hypothetical protein